MTCSTDVKHSHQVSWRAGGQTDRQVARQPYKETDLQSKVGGQAVRTVRRKDGILACRQEDRKAERQKGRKAARQPNSHTSKQTYSQR